MPPPSWVAETFMESSNSRLLFFLLTSKVKFTVSPMASWPVSKSTTPSATMPESLARYWAISSLVQVPFFFSFIVQDTF